MVLRSSAHEQKEENKMSKLNTKHKAFTALNNYRLSDGTQAQWFCQLPKSWKDYVLNIAEHNMQFDYAICSLDIPDILESIKSMTIWEATYDTFFPYADYWKDIKAEMDEQKRKNRAERKQA